MANVVIKFDSYNQPTPQKKQNSSEVYVDVSLQSKYDAEMHHIGTPNIVNKDKLLDVGNNTSLNVSKSSSSLVQLKLVTDEKVVVVKNSFKVAKSVNVKAVQNAIENIFNFFPGERVLYPDFGSRLKMHLYNGITSFNIEQIVAEIYSNVEQFDERVVIDDIQVVYDEQDFDDNTVALRITYHIDGLSAEHYTYDYSYVTGN